MPSNQAAWYKDAVIYQLHVRSFQDGNNDGIGDFSGLIQRLDYLKWLGISAIWLLPFYPSPLRDDGYDVADFRSINPSYGTMREFRAFIREAHARGIRVITELILNHTSDQHAWFQKARRSPPGSRARNYYVWSDTDTKYSNTRIIFTDTEISNWTWDPVANSFYWHRFFSHQPDLNFDSPDVMREIISIMRFWFKIGVDGLRLDAAPYLCERDGTSNENLPETHDVIKRLRSVLDKEFPDRVLLAEANQWPEDISAYFGDGDECHMAFHFPLMPRLFLSLANQDRFPIYDIMQQTPALPDGCQWAIFLRNHDEMTLEMVTDRERAFMYSVYAPEPRARINVGIRRRLAPLLGNDRRKIELLLSLLLSMPGTPIIYYGDEIGMGDNIFLNDRDGVRTPMQWSPDRNGGFSRVDAQQLFLPAIQDTMFGYEVVNVEGQTRTTSSLLNWTRRLLGVRQSHKAFGQGRISFLYPENRHIIAYLREHEDVTILCVGNFADSAQAVTIDLRRYVGRTPVEMIGWSAFPRITDQPYAFTLPNNAFFWFLLRSDLVSGDDSSSVRSPELTTIVLPKAWASLANAATATKLAELLAANVFTKETWYTDHIATASHPQLLESIELSTKGSNPLLAIVQTESDDTTYRNLLLLNRQADTPALDSSIARNAVARSRTGPEEFLINNATHDDALWHTLVNALVTEKRYTGRSGTLRFTLSTQNDTATEIGLPPNAQVRTVTSDWMISGILADSIIMKVYRRLESGIHPERELAAALARVGYHHMPVLLGTISYESDNAEETTAVGVAYRYHRHRGTGREIALGLIRQRLERRRLQPTPSTTGHKDDDGFGGFVRYAALIGRRIAEFHSALANQGDDPHFSIEYYTEEDVAREIERAQNLIQTSHTKQGRAALSKQVNELGKSLLGQPRSRIHGNLILDKILVASDDVLLVGLEGNPFQSLAERREKRSPLLDLATMALSFDIAAEDIAAHVSSDRTEGWQHFRPMVSNLAHRVREALYSGYREIMGNAPSRESLQFFRLQMLLDTQTLNRLDPHLHVGLLDTLLAGVRRVEVTE